MRCALRPRRDLGASHDGAPVLPALQMSALAPTKSSFRGSITRLPHSLCMLRSRGYPRTTQHSVLGWLLAFAGQDSSCWDPLKVSVSYMTSSFSRLRLAHHPVEPRHPRHWARGRRHLHPGHSLGRCCQLQDRDDVPMRRSLRGPQLRSRVSFMTVSVARVFESPPNARSGSPGRDRATGFASGFAAPSHPPAGCWRCGRGLLASAALSRRNSRRRASRTKSEQSHSQLGR